MSSLGSTTPQSLLKTFLTQPFALSLAPGFFRFYAHIGVISALEESDLLHVTQCSGASAGALVGGFLASGKTPKEMVESVLKIDREAIWDAGIGHGFGLLRGEKLQKLLESELECKTFEQCTIPLGVTTYDILKMKTQSIRSGPLALAMRGSACFPLMFSPVPIDNSLHIDGGIFDPYGLVALPGCPLEDSRLVVNVVFNQDSIHYEDKSPDHLLPEHLRGLSVNLLTIVLSGVPLVDPFTMQTAGPIAFEAAKSATLRALQSCHVQQLNSNHWAFFVDAAGNVPQTVAPPISSSSASAKGKEKEKVAKKQAPSVSKATTVEKSPGSRKKK